MKACTLCKVVTPLEEFGPAARAKDGRQSACRACCRARNRKWREENPEAIRKYRAANPEANREAMRKWREANPEANRAQAGRSRAAKLQRTPAWACKGTIDAIYRDVAFTALLFGIDTSALHVDHVVPMQGDTVSGLHVHENLRIMRASDNCAKSNAWPAPPVKNRYEQVTYQTIRGPRP